MLLNIIPHSSDTQRFVGALECVGFRPKDQISAFNDCCIKPTRKYLGPEDSCWHFLSKEIQIQSVPGDLVDLVEIFVGAWECVGCSPKDHIGAFNDCCIKQTRRSKGIFGSTGFHRKKYIYKD